MGLVRTAGRVAGLGALLGGAVTSYAHWEARQYTLRRYEVAVLPPGMRPLKVLHLSDLHMVPGQRRKQEWVRDLASLHPDLVIDTGDNLAHRDAVWPVLESLDALLDVPGVFVHGSNDYFEPGLRNPFAYLLPDDGRRHTDVPELPWRDLSAGLGAAGWLDLTNRRGTLTVGEATLAFAGVDDPHLGYDDLPAIAGPADPDADLRIGVTHAPYLRVLDQLAADGYEAIVAGHTHGGQVCLPWPGGRALTTNCDLEPARARGLHRHPADSRPGDPGSAALHVSAGLGTNPYLRMRIACRPEASLLTLVPRERDTEAVR
ncbi:metallophosphoesterase [Nocardioides sp. zg-536]|uniref:Metallophosphoesterase n=1 Tax=Nocardioides faecalis TaxID=2803858 RepID=A0A938Y6J7_9ACTN|nr:metallophosphoesterase [Nocardioides faecalis]MBM9460998.1 metallophosphoesterase [Nocardioides faecalis]MBS4752096.1 metallophosphoesterase [Nocardioides faecalis]QVI59094.1 metallophosphoesterase [Nocardioides faecalis]